MKQMRWWLLLGLLAAPGCLDLPGLVREPPPPPKQAVQAPPPPPPVVMPDEINSDGSNFKEELEKFNAELEYAANPPVPKPAPPAGKDGKP